MKLPKADGTTMVIMVTNQVASLGINKITTKVRGILIKSHGKIRTKSHGTKTRSPIMVTRNPNLRTLVSLLLKM